MRKLWVILFFVGALLISTFLTVSGQTSNEKSAATEMLTDYSDSISTTLVETPTLNIVGAYIEPTNVGMDQVVPISVTMIVSTGPTATQKVILPLMLELDINLGISEAITSSSILAPTSTDMTVSATDTSVTIASLPTGSLPPGDWTVRARNTDDASIIIVNGELVGAATIRQKPDTDWISINDLLLPGVDNLITVASFNGMRGGTWSFSIRQNDTSVWGNEGKSGDDFNISYVQTVAIKPDGTVEKVAPLTNSPDSLSDKWSVAVRKKTADVGVVLVNGTVVAGAGNWQDSSGWVGINGLLRADQDNTISMYVWNFDGKYSWRFSVRRDEDIIWDQERSGSGLMGVVFSDTVKINSAGELIQE